MPFYQGHALLIGVSEHRFHDNLDTATAGNDIQAVKAILLDPNYCGYPANQVTPLTAAAATQANILAALDELAQVPAEHTIFLFFTGHGMSGTDGAYHLASHDVKLKNGRIMAGTGISEQILLEKLRQLRAERLILFFNACFSGNIAPGSFSGEAEDLLPETKNPTGKTAHALLATGEGRILIVASRENQRSWFRKSQANSFFTQALVAALKGEAANNNGFVTAFGLYEYLYEEVKEMAADVDKQQEPLLTAIQTVGTFPVALYRGSDASNLGDVSDDSDLLDDVDAKRIEQDKADKALKRIIKIVNTGGGAYVKGNVNTGGGAFVGRDQVVQGDLVQGDKVAGDKVGGDKINVGNISGSQGIAIGRGASTQVVGERGVAVGGNVGGHIVTGDHNKITQGSTPDEIAQAFATIELALMQSQLEGYPRTVAENAVRDLRQEAENGERADENKVQGMLTLLKQMAPDIAAVAVATFLSPIRGLSLVFKKVAAKAQGS